MSTNTLTHYSTGAFGRLEALESQHQTLSGKVEEESAAANSLKLQFDDLSNVVNEQVRLYVRICRRFCLLDG